MVLSQGTSNPNTGMFTNIILLTGIIGAAAGIFIITLRKNKFQNI